MDRERTHEKRLAVADPEKELRYFFDMMRGLFFTRFWLFCCNFHHHCVVSKRSFKKLEALIHILDPKFRYAIEVIDAHIMV
ncbi:MAG: hypothetical protein ACJ71D_11750 [Nitrososphaera sp.]